MKRREFIVGSSAALAFSSLAQTKEKKYRVGVIGHTGRGNFGHGLDYVWLSNPQAEIVGVADPHDMGRNKAMERLKTTRGFADYRKMLSDRKPDIVAVCTRHPDQHFEMMSAAILAGAKGIYVEKPFCRSPEEADKLLSLSEKHNCKIAVAHRNRYHPVLETVRSLIQEGAIGKLLEVRGRGKGDHRGGCEDLWVLGSHVLNLISYFCGKAKTCSAVVLKDGEPAKEADFFDGREGLGKLAGNEVHARFTTESGVMAYFDSIANDKTKGEGFGLKIIGSKGVIQLQCDRNPLASIFRGNPFSTNLKKGRWEAVSTAGIGKEEPLKDIHRNVFNHNIPAQDLIVSIEQDKSPICDARQGAETVEMICSVFASHLQNGAAVSLPLKSRKNPFGF